MIDLDALKQRVIEGEAAPATMLTEAALAAGCSPTTILTDALYPAMDTVGRRMQAHEYFLPDVLLAAQAMQACAARLKPLLVGQHAIRSIGTAVACTVIGDLHDIGKNLVCILLQGAGFTVVDLGNNCPAERVVEAVRRHRPDVVALSAMLTTTMLNMKGIIEALEAAGLRDRIHIMVGGAPVDASFAHEIGADFYADDAPTASAHARRRMETATQ